MTLPEGKILKECASTQDELRALAVAGAPAGTWVASSRQTAGRGRRGRTWISEEGGLYLSFLLRPEDLSLLTWLPIAAGVFAAEALGLLVKWPNDLWDARGKVGGILCEGVSGPAGSFVLVGIGLNCGHAPRISEQPTSFLATDAGRAREIVREAWAASLLSFDRGQCADLSARFWRRTLHPAGSSVETDQGAFRVRGDLGAAGELWVEGEGGVRALTSEEIRLSPAHGRGRPES